MFDIFIANLPYLLRAAVVTVQLAFSGIALGTLLGVGLGILSVLMWAPARFLITGYVFVIRGIPVLVWMFLGYYALPAVGIIVGDYYAVLTTLVIYTSAFVTEIARGAILSVRRGQIESAKSVGMRWPMILRLVVLPQAFKMSLPALVNNSVMMIKQSSYASVVGVWELSYAAREIVERSLAPFQIFLGVMLLYFIICYPLTIVANRLEKRFAYQH